MTSLSRVVWTCVAVGFPTVACGARTGLLAPALGETRDAGETPDTGVDSSSTCQASPVPIDPNVPNLYFILDVSSSMSEMSKWTNVRTVVGQLITQLGPSAQFGAAVFPARGTSDTCARGAEVMPLRLGDTQGVTESAFLQATSFSPNGGTPTAATIEGLTPELASFHGPTYAILATDGGPNCDAALSCDVSMCTSNMDSVPGCPTEGPNCCGPNGVGGLGCLDGTRTADAVAQLEKALIKTYVLGIPGSAPYASVLDNLAIVGGTQRSSEPPFYYRVDTADTATLSAAFAEIAAATMASCQFTLSVLPANPEVVNVTIDGTIVPQNGPDGWTLEGAQLTLLGASCSAIQGQDMSSSPLGVTQGCPTVTN